MSFPVQLRLSLTVGKDTDGSHAIFEDIVEPGRPRQTYTTNRTRLFFLEGEFIAEIGGKMFRFKPGDIGFIQKGPYMLLKTWEPPKVACSTCLARL